MSNVLETQARETKELYAISLDESFLSLQDAARFLAVPPSFLYELSRPGRMKIKSYRCGKYRRFLKRDLMDWIRDQNRMG